MLLPLISRWITAGSLVWRYSSPSWQCEEQDREKCMTSSSFHPLKSSRALETKPKFSLAAKIGLLNSVWKCLCIPRLYVLMQFRLVLSEYLLLFDPHHIATARIDVAAEWLRFGARTTPWGLLPRVRSHSAPLQSKVAHLRWTLPKSQHITRGWVIFTNMWWRLMNSIFRQTGIQILNPATSVFVTGQLFHSKHQQNTAIWRANSRKANLSDAATRNMLQIQIEALIQIVVPGSWRLAVGGSKNRVQPPCHDLFQSESVGPRRSVRTTHLRCF